MLKPTMPASHDVTAIGALYSTGTKSGITAAAVPNAPSALTPTKTSLKSPFESHNQKE